MSIHRTRRFRYGIWLETVLLVASVLAATARPARAIPAGQMGLANMYLYPHLHNLIWDPAKAGHIFAASPAGGWQSNDAGRTWSVLTPDTPNLHYGRMLLEPSTRTLYLYRWGDQLLYRSTDFGASWELRHRAMLYTLALAPDKPGSLYAVHGDMRMRRSDNGGASWWDLQQPIDNARETLLAVAPSGRLYALVDRQLYRSDDAGASWRMLGNWPHDARPRELLVARDGALIASIASDDVPSVSAKALWRSADDGKTWTAAALATPRIAVIAQGSDGVLWVGSDDGHVWRNLIPKRWDERAAWRELPLQLVQPINLRNDIPYTPVVTDIAPGPNGSVLVGTIHGIYRAASPDGPAVLRARGLLVTAALPSAPEQANDAARYFAETGHSLREPFLSAWESYGGVTTLGYPRTNVFIERNLETGKDELVQYFERGRLGVPIEQRGPVVLGRSAPSLLASMGLFFTSAAPQPGCQFFPRPGFNLCEPFLSAWQAHGGRAGLGAPLSNAFQPNGRTAANRAQWFERARLESTRNGIVFGLLGNEELQARGWLP